MSTFELAPKIPDDSDINLFFNNTNLGLGIKKPLKKFEVAGDIKANNFYLLNGQLVSSSNDLLISNRQNEIILGKDKINLNSTNVGINKQNPQHSLDINGDLGFYKNLYGANGKIMSYDNNIILNPENKYSNTEINGDARFQDKVIIGDNNVKMENNSLSIKNKIYDENGNELIDLNSSAFNINKPIKKPLNIHGKVNFIDISKGVNISEDENTDKTTGGELYVDKQIKTNKITIEEDKDRTIDFIGDSSSNIKLGKYTYFSNVNDLGQTSLIGNNLYTDGNSVKVSSSSDDGYRGMIMNSTNGIQFYVNNENSVKDYQPKLPDLTISNSGQLIYTIPVLPIEFQLENVNNEVYEYIRKELGNKVLGSNITFTTTDFLRQSKVFNALKNSETTVKCFIINKLNNNVEKHFDINLN